MNAVGVFLSSSTTVAPLMLGEAEILGQALAEAKYQTVFGGCSAGCMGRLAEGVLRGNGSLIGVVPEMDFLEGIVQEDMTEKILVAGMHERKSRMLELSQAFLVFPGGIGTLDELFDVLALRLTGTHQKPVILYNYLGYWTPLIEALETFSQQRMITGRLDELFVVLDRPVDVINYLNTCFQN